MKAEGRVFKFGDNVDTDVIIPARYLNSSDPAELATHCMEDIDKNFVKNVNDENIDIKDINDKEINYRHKVENIDKDTALILKDELTKNDIKSELIITGINKDNSLNVEYKVKAEHKEKCVKAINEYIKRFADLNKVENVKKENTIDKIISRAKTMADSINNKNKEQIKEKVKRVPIRER